MAEQPAPKTHYTKKGEGKPQPQVPWAYREHKLPGSQAGERVEAFTEDRRRASEELDLKNALKKVNRDRSLIKSWSYYESLLGPCPPGRLEDGITGVEPDPVVKSLFIYGLSGINFREYLRSKDVALVLFYNNEGKLRKDKQAWAMEEMKKAAPITAKANHAYATVECSKDRELCVEEDMTCSFPRMRLYSRGRGVGEVKDILQFDYKRMKGMMEMAPV